MTELIKAVLPAPGNGWLSGGTGWFAGYVVRRADVAEAKNPAALHAELGLGFPGSPLRSDAPHVDVLRIPTTAYTDILAPGTSDVEPVFHDHPPMSGTGFVESATGFVPYWWAAPAALPAGTTMWRHHQDGSEELLAAYPHVAEGWMSARPGFALTPVPVRSPELIGLWAEVGGEKLLADVLPDGTVIVCSPHERDGMQRSARGFWWRVEPSGAVERLYAVRVLADWRDRPVQVVGLENSESGNVARIVYLGHDAFDAESLGMAKTDAGVYESVVPAADVHNLREAQTEIPLGPDEER